MNNYKEDIVKNKILSIPFIRDCLRKNDFKSAYDFLNKNLDRSWVTNNGTTASIDLSDIGSFTQFLWNHGIDAMTGSDQIFEGMFSQVDVCAEISILPNINRICSYAFTGSGFNKIILSEGLNVIDNYAFSYMQNLTEIVLPASLTKIGRGIFQGCNSLTSLALDLSIFYITGHPINGDYEEFFRNFFGYSCNPSICINSSYLNYLNYGNTQPIGYSMPVSGLQYSNINGNTTAPSDLALSAPSVYTTYYSNYSTASPELYNSNVTTGATSNLDYQATNKYSHN